MTSKERVLSAYGFRRPDRIPRFDGFWEEKLAPWDLGAGALLVEEAEGTTTGYFGERLALDEGHIVAAPAPVHAAMLDLLRRVESEAALPPLKPRER